MSDETHDARGQAKTNGHLTRNQLDAIRGELITRRRHLARQQANQLSALGDPDKHHIADLEEMGGDSSDADSVCALVDLSSSTIDEIDAALGRLDQGRYGICEECQEPIALARLEFLPFAALCVGCKRERELQGDAQV